MKKIRVLLVGFLLVLLVIDCFSADLEVKGSASTSNEKPGKSDSVIESKNVDQVKKGDAQVGDSKVGVENIVTKNDKQSNLNEEHSVRTDKGSSSEELPVKKGDENKEKKSNELESKEMPKEGGNEGDSGFMIPVRKEGSPGEECDPSNMCTDDVKKLAACLRVPGNESPDLSLLIQNRGNGPLTVTISAPDFVWLEKRKVQLKEKGGIEVKVSIKNRGTENLISLTAGNGPCNLDFRDLIAHKESDNFPKFTHINFLTWTPTIAIVSFAALLILASGWLCISLRRKHFSSNGSKYQRLDMELPVSGEGKSESNVNDGWDNNWDDSWDDEEAPKTPSMPVTPSLSSKGLASRRFIKDGWKD